MAASARILRSCRGVKDWRSCRGASRSFGAVISIRADLVYVTPEGCVRQLITDSEITRPEHVGGIATARALHFEPHPGAKPVSRVDPRAPLRRGSNWYLDEILARGDRDSTRDPA